MKDIKTKYIEVETIEEIDETSDVYDITVEDNHNFFAKNRISGYRIVQLWLEFLSREG